MTHEFLRTIHSAPLCIDGATGTMIQQLDLGDDFYGGAAFRMLGDLLCFSCPEAVIDIHLAFLRAGAQAVETNSFGSSPLRLAEYDFSTLDGARFAGNPYGLELRGSDTNSLAYHLSRRAAELAQQAIAQFRQEPGCEDRPLFVLGSMGPSNHVISATTANLRRSSFDHIADNFYRQALGLIDGGADVLLFETQQDILELKAGIFGARRALAERKKQLPIIGQVTVDRFGRMQLFNTDIHAALVTVQGVGLDVFGMNCSIGPDLMEKTVERLCAVASVPVSVIPNAGLPHSEEGKTVFKFPPEAFAEYQGRFVGEFGARVVGGCCGTTPEHIACTVEVLKSIRPKKTTPPTMVYVSGPQEAVPLDSSENLIRFGERLNLRGSKKVRDAVENDTGIDHDILDTVVRGQVQELGCQIIDVCMDSNQVDTVSTLCKVVQSQTIDFSGAMCLDSFQADALTEAVKVYPGRPILNSISLEEVSPGVPKMDVVIEATQGHDPVFVGLCTGTKGPAATAQDKAALAGDLLARALERYGIGPERIFIDVNVFPVGSESDAAMNFAVETLEGIRLVKTQHPKVKTILGVGNLTNGLAAKPYMRIVLTSVFLDEARKRGLDAAIINPNHYLFVEDLDPEHYQLALRIILEHDMDAFDQLETIAEAKRGGPQKVAVRYDTLDTDTAITEKIKDGHKDRVPGSFTFRGHEYSYEDRIVEQTRDALERWEPLDFVNQRLMAAMQELGDGFAKGEVSLPHLLRSADVMRQVMGFIEQYLSNQSGLSASEEIQYKGVVVLGTVYQDVHSIGKDLARTLLENYGYKVIDLGVMTPLQAYIDAAVTHKADAIGMSALLVQTSNHMITVSRMMEEQGLDLPLIIGGAPVSDRHAAYVALAGRSDPEEMRGNVFFCRTAMDGVNMMNLIKSSTGLAAVYEDNRRKLARKYTQAQRRLEIEAKLLATLPRREISYEGLDRSGITGFRSRVYRIPLPELAPQLDRHTLFSLNWRFGGVRGKDPMKTEKEDLESMLQRWVRDAHEQGWLKPQGVMGLFPCYSEGEHVILLDPEDLDRELVRLHFSTVIGAGNEDLVSGAQYFMPRQAESYDMIGLQLSTAGPQVEAQVERFKSKDDFESALFLQGLSDRIAEDMADFLHKTLRETVGVPADCGQRWSPGYPGMKDISQNILIFEALNANAALGVEVTETGEFRPTGTTAAAVSFHKEARYT
ncbi:MAG: dihydropteroate synthase [Candidatus Hydrogenedentes bacterium]|nr:dihydropteroate synthase [Candidatus Hydrogenedentota bacterium]